MEPTTLLFVEVFGMIALAAFLSTALFRDRPVFEGPESDHLQEDAPLLYARLLCPEWGTVADVAVGLDRSGPKARQTTVLSCSLLHEGATCDMQCLEEVAQA
jgi:hypothetical protein